MSDDRRCPSLLGRMFGHKYVKKTLHSTFEFGYCVRCGRRR